jgi:hypothetical protein
LNDFEMRRRGITSAALSHRGATQSSRHSACSRRCVSFGASNGGSVPFTYNANLVVSDLTIANSDGDGIELIGGLSPQDSSLNIGCVTILDFGDDVTDGRSFDGHLMVTDPTVGGSD